MSVTDLDEIRARREARAKAAGKVPKVKFGGKTYSLPAELPFGVFTAFADLGEEDTDTGAAMNLLLEQILGDQTDEFVAAGPSLEDIKALFEVLGDAYETEEVPEEA